MQLFARIIERVPRQVLEAAVSVRSRSQFVAGCTQWFANKLRESDVTIRSGAGTGLRFSAGIANGGYFASGTAEIDFEQALADLLGPAMTFYDVGTNFGLYSLIAARIVGPAGSVIGFEPLVANRRLLEHNIRLNNLLNIRCLPVAIGDKDGESSFRVSSNLFCGALADQSWVPDSLSHDEVVQVRRFDSLLADGRIPAPDLVKMDIEGGEIAALAGAEALLASARPILLIELHDTAGQVSEVLHRHDYVARAFGTTAPIELLNGNRHIVAFPTEHHRLDELLERFGDPNFPLCERCSQ